MRRYGKEGIRMKKRLMNNIGLKMLAFLAALMLWFVVVNIEDPVITQTYNNIPVSVINAEVLAEANQTYQIVDETQNVNVTVRANRSVLNKIKSENIVVVADMKELTLKTQIPLRVVINGYEGDYEEAYATPRNLQVKLEEEQTKKFPIVPATTGTVRDGYALGEIKAVPENISIRGPQSVINKISRVEAAVSVSGLSTDSVLQSELVLYDEENNVIDQSLLANNLGAEGVSVSVQLLNTKNIPVEFDTSEIQAADGYEFAGITYEPQEIQVAGTKEELAKVNKIQIPASALAQTGLKTRTEQVVDVSKFLPENLRLTDENANSIVVTITVERNGTKLYEVSMGSIVVKGLSDELTMKYENADVIEVQIEGPKEALETFSADNNVSINLTNYKAPGRYVVPVEVTVPSGCILEESVSVSIILEEKE